MKKFIGQTILAVFLLGCTVTPNWGADSAAAAEKPLDREFCRKCHTKEIDDIETKGMAHKTEIDCVDCHAGHKPKSFENIPRCSLCHSDAPHYNQLQCLNCHRNPHRPLEIKFPKKAYAECLTCHETQGEELQQFPSYHSTLACTDCHHQHKDLPECTSCHQSHDPTMAEETCQTCHAPHKPLQIAYSDDTPTSFCSPCHAEATGLLEKTQSKHGQLSCAECHMNQHGTIPACEECHGKPHAPGIHNKFSSCGECHGTAHQLN
ncbi:MAG: cytochrome C [Desulfuromusa sp.]|nr:cytochrome C [Desulfuromusa sp.]